MQIRDESETGNAVPLWTLTRFGISLSFAFFSRNQRTIMLDEAADLFPSPKIPDLDHLVRAARCQPFAA